MEALKKLEFNPNVKQRQLLSQGDIEILQKEIPLWEVVIVEKESRLTHQFKFKNFITALSFTQKIGELAENFNHHPSICLEWGKASVTWWTHSIGGLHQNDFIMAYKTQEIYEEFND